MLQETKQDILRQIGLLEQKEEKLDPLTPEEYYDRYTLRMSLLRPGLLEYGLELLVERGLKGLTNPEVVVAMKARVDQLKAGIALKPIIPATTDIECIQHILDHPRHPLLRLADSILSSV